MRCAVCFEHWEPVEQVNAGACPRCGSEEPPASLRCDSCPLEKLEQVRRSSRAGHLLDRVLDLDFNIQNLSVPWGQVSAEEIKALQVLHIERDKYRAELFKRHQEEREMRNPNRRF